MSTQRYGRWSEGSNPSETTRTRCMVRIQPPELITGRSIRGNAGHKINKMNIVFTDIDGVLNTVNRSEWNQESIKLYDDLCEEYNLKCVLTSTWRVNRTIQEMRNVFNQQGVKTKIVDFTPIIPFSGRGEEIEEWLKNNSWNKFIIIDDNIRDIESFGLPNIIKCRGWVGFSNEEYNLAKKILNNGKE